ncbi:MAG TPA: hypothetical protein VGU27_08085 [Candidatus Eisenbacteria bacterium]|nr:hypothetical protein [Candidatus Eisenbacteria bacterium]
MKSLRVPVAAVLAALALVALLGATRPASRTLEPDKLVILSTVDVKGKTSPCG